MPSEEQVLVFEQKVFAQAGSFHGLKFDIADFLRAIFAPGVLRFMPRSQAEPNPEYKQLIPYVILGHQRKYLNYVRGKRAGEKRLVGNRSIGIGGHINPVDEIPLFDIDFRKAYLTAVKREVQEEVSIESAHSDRIVALLNDDTNEVGQVHLGIVHYWQLDSAKVEKREQMITQMTFMTIAELQEVRQTMETWSQLCMDGLCQIAENPDAGIRLDTLFENK